MHWPGGVGPNLVMCAARPKCRCSQELFGLQARSQIKRNIESNTINKHRSLNQKSRPKTLMNNGATNTNSKLRSAYERKSIIVDGMEGSLNRKRLITSRSGNVFHHQSSLLRSRIHNHIIFCGRASRSSSTSSSSNHDAKKWRNTTPSHRFGTQNPQQYSIWFMCAREDEIENGIVNWSKLTGSGFHHEQAPQSSSSFSSIQFLLLLVILFSELWCRIWKG